MKNYCDDFHVWFELFFFESWIPAIDAPDSLVNGTKKLLVFFDNLKFAAV